MVRGFVVISSVLLVLSVPTSAPAQGPTTTAETPRDRGVRLFQEAAAHYRDGRFRVAVELLRESYALHPEPVVLFNLARSLEGLGELAEALDAYSRFLEAAPDAPDRGAVQARIETLERLVNEQRAREAAERAPAEAPVPAPVTRSEPTPREPDAIDAGAIAVAAVGGAGLLVGAILGGVALASHERWSDGRSQMDAVDALAEARDIATGANVAFAIGGALALLGGVWLIVDAADPGAESTDEEASSVRLGVSASGVRLDVRW